MSLFGLLAIPAVLVVASVYLWHVNRAFTAVPPSVASLSPHRFSLQDIREAALKDAEHVKNALACLPPRTGRRYIIVGGSGLVGGWIVLHLLHRGEDPMHIRIINRHRPTRRDMLSGKAAEICFVPADIQNLESLRKAFLAAWPQTSGVPTPGITVFHTVADMRFYERHPSLIQKSTAINVEGIRNSLVAAKEIGADIFVYTSSAGIPVCRTNRWIWPWQKYPKTMVQVINDDIPTVPPKHHQYSSNYSYSKALAESLVREADNANSRFRTGSIRAGAAIFGPEGDMTAGMFLARGTNPAFNGPMVQSFSYAENVSYAHLLYEQRLLELESNPSLPSIGGQAFLTTDAGNPISFNDLFLTLNTLSGGKVKFPVLPALPLFLIAHLVELYHVLQAGYLPKLLPPITSDVRNLQPSVFDVAAIHFIIDDSRARRPPHEAGLGYAPPFTTLQGLCRVVKYHLEETDSG